MKDWEPLDRLWDKPAGPYPAPKEYRYLEVDLALEQVFAQAKKGEHWMYCPRSGVLTVCWPLPEENEAGE